MVPHHLLADEAESICRILASSRETIKMKVALILLACIAAASAQYTGYFGVPGSYVSICDLVLSYHNVFESIINTRNEHKMIELR